ncbi:hypothetical protein GCM10023331_40230 [Algivirga pacifica]|uniref:CAAX prenyl protease 2/Lysostaphin resistance protein A-like domain-containing protein n=2 Tax=Algivirga pacifica TaxID=1162670 RepID=A0ABP9DLL6_9BACT
MLGGYLIGQFLSIIIVLPYFGFDLDAIFAMTANMTGDESYRTPLLLIQGVSSFCLFGAGPWYFWKFTKGESPMQLFHLKPMTNNRLILAGGGIILLAIPTIGWFVYLNQQMALPEAFKELELYMKDMEVRLAETTLFLLGFQSIYQFILGLLVVAVLAGILEEFVFRGILQNMFLKQWGNAHMAIWISAIVFSAIHMQFYGFLPRMLLGALFGYLYWWSGNLYVPMFAHFVNNAYTLVSAYVGQQFFETNLEEEMLSVQAPSFWFILISTPLFIGALYSFYRVSTAGVPEQKVPTVE